MCHVSCVTCHLSPILCHVSPVTSLFFMLKKIHLYIYSGEEKKLDLVVELVGGGSVINGAYPFFNLIKTNYTG